MLCSSTGMVQQGLRACMLTVPRTVRRACREAGMMAALRHPNVVGFMGVCASPPCVATGASAHSQQQLPGRPPAACVCAAPCHPWEAPLTLCTCPLPASPSPEYCGRGSLTDVLRGGKNSVAKAKQLDWARRLNMVRAGAALRRAGQACVPAPRMQALAAVCWGRAVPTACAPRLSLPARRPWTRPRACTICISTPRPSSTATSRAQTFWWTSTGRSKSRVCSVPRR